MSTSEISIKIGCEGTELEQKYEQLQISVSIQENKLNEYAKHLQEVLEVKKVPVLSMEISGNVELADVTKIELFGHQFGIKTKKSGNKNYIYGDFANADTLLFLRKLERILHPITQCNTKLNLKCSFYEADKFKNKQQYQLSELLNHLKIKGNLKIDEKTVETAKKCLIKVSPKFTQSPLFVFFQLFAGTDIKLELQSFEDLQDKSESLLLSKMFSLKRHNRKLNSALKKLQKTPAKLTLCLQKLISVQITGSSQLLALVLSHL